MAHHIALFANWISTPPKVDYISIAPYANVFSEWQDAMHIEYDALMAIGTWKLVPHSLEDNLIGNIWVVRIKHKLNCSVECYKGCLVAMSFHQQVGVDF